MNAEPLVLLAALSSALSHKLRTPLSVVMNDLSYFQSLLPGEDVGRSLARLEEISNLISVITVPEPGKRLDRATMKAHLERLFSERTAKWESFPASDPETFFFVALAEFRRSVELLLMERGSQPKSVIREEDESISLEMTGAPAPRLHEHGLYRSLTECFVKGVEQETLIAPLVDAAVLYHNGSIEIELGVDAVRATLTFTALAPYVRHNPSR